MNEYTIYCTEEQTKKALELGAPIQFASINDIRLRRYIEVESNNKVYVIPTSEQMIGWLEDNKLIIQIECSEYCDYFYRIKRITYYQESGDYELNNVDYVYDFSSRKEATLAAIDAGLDYLSNNENK